MPGMVVSASRFCSPRTITPFSAVATAPLSALAFVCIIAFPPLCRYAVRLGGTANYNAMVRHGIKPIGHDACQWSPGRCQLADPPLEKPALDLILAERQRTAIAVRRFFHSPRSPQQIRPRRMVQVIVLERLTNPHAIEKRQSLLGSFGHRDSDGFVQLDHRRRGHA